MRLIVYLFIITFWRENNAFSSLFDDFHQISSQPDYRKWKEQLTIQRNRDRLSTDIHPIYYDISIQPWIHLKDSAEFHFSGSVSILFRCDSYQQTLAIHVAPNIVLDDEHVAVFDGKMRPVKIAFTAYLVKRNLKMIIFVKKLKPLKTYRVLFSKYSSKILDDGKGFYFQEYKEGNDKRFVASAMLSPLYARNVFPCFDDPQFESQFALKIIRKRRWKSQSIMPIKKTTSLENDWETDEYEKTPMMQIFQFTFAVNEYSFIEGLTKSGKTVRLWAPERDLHLCQFSLDEVIEGLNFNEVYFDTPYPLPKLDVVTAMSMSDEETGSSTYGLLLLLRRVIIKRDNIDVRAKQIKKNIIKHEMGHIWIGNILRINWFDSLWFLEGFAGYMEGKFSNKSGLLKEMELDKGFHQTIRGLYIDDSNSYSAIAAYPYSAKDVEKLFNDLIFLKGYVLMRMIEKSIGAENFQKAIQTVMKDESKQPMSTKDLWAYMDKVLHFTKIRELMRPWENQVGYPILTVTRTSSTTLKFNQQGNRMSNKNLLWPIPIKYITESGETVEKYQDIFWLRKEEQHLIMQRPLKKSDWIVINPDQIGFCRIKYDVANLENVIRQLNSNHQEIPAMGRLQFLDDFYYFFSRQHLPKPELIFEMLSYLKEEKEYPIWLRIKEIFFMLHSVFDTETYVEKVDKFIRSLVSKGFDEINWIKSSLKGSDTKSFSDSVILNEACRYGLKKCLETSQIYFQDWLRTKTFKTFPFWYKTIMCTGVKYSGSNEWFKVYREATKKKYNKHQRYTLAQSLTCTSDPRLIKRIWKVLQVSSSHPKNAFKTITSDLIENLFQNLEARPVLTKILCSQPMNISSTFGYTATVSTLKYMSLPADCLLNKQIDLLKQTTFIRPPFDLEMSIVTKNQRDFIRKEYLETLKNWLNANFN